MRTDEEALEYLKRRGIEPGVIEVLRALLESKQILQTPSRRHTKAVEKFSMARSENTKEERYSEKRECVRRAMDEHYHTLKGQGLKPWTVALHIQRYMISQKQKPWFIDVNFTTIRKHVTEYMLPDTTS